MYVSVNTVSSCVQCAKFKAALLHRYLNFELVPDMTQL